MGEGMNQDDLKIWFRRFQWLKEASGSFGSLVSAISGGPRSGRGVDSTLMLRRAHYEEAQAATELLRIGFQSAQVGISSPSVLACGSRLTRPLARPRSGPSLSVS